MFIPAGILMTWQNPAKPTMAMEKPTGMPRKKRMKIRAKIPVMPMIARLKIDLQMV